MCSDQEAVDLVRGIEHPQEASRALVEHALARFSTDNLSCMIVRFDGQRVQQTVERKTEPIGVEGDPASQKGGRQIPASPAHASRVPRATHAPSHCAAPRSAPGPLPRRGSWRALVA